MDGVFPEGRWHRLAKQTVFLGICVGYWLAVPVRGTAAQPTAAQSGTQVFEAGQVHLGTSRVFVHVQKTGLGHEHAVMGRLRSGRLQLDTSQNSGQLVFDMASFQADPDIARRFLGLQGTTDPSTRQSVTNNMLGADVLDVRQYPTATFTIDSATRLPETSPRGLPQYQLNGEFTLHGVTLPIRVVADVEEKEGWTHLRGGFSILQTRYGITPFTKAFGAIGVADPLQIWGDLWIARQRLVAQVPTQSSH